MAREPDPPGPLEWLYKIILPAAAVVTGMTVYWQTLDALRVMDATLNGDIKSIAEKQALVISRIYLIETQIKDVRELGTRGHDENAAHLERLEARLDALQKELTELERQLAAPPPRPHARP